MIVMIHQPNRLFSPPKGCLKVAPQQGVYQETKTPMPSRPLELDRVVVGLADDAVLAVILPARLVATRLRGGSRLRLLHRLRLRSPVSTRVSRAQGPSVSEEGGEREGRRARRHSGERTHSSEEMPSTFGVRHVECHGSSSVSIAFWYMSMTVASLMPRGWYAERPSLFASLYACATAPKGSPSPGTFGSGGFLLLRLAAFSSATIEDDRTADVGRTGAAARARRRRRRAQQRRGRTSVRAVTAMRL